MEKKSILVFGAGWLGGKIASHFGAELSKVDIGNSQMVKEELARVKPSHVINTAGKTGRPNIDWCEDHRSETVYSNITGPLVLMKECLDAGIHLTHLSSGCIFDGASPQPGGFTEEDEPHTVSFYAWTKATSDSILKHFPVLVLRLRMPIDDEPTPRNLIDKLVSYPMVIDVENSVTIIDDLIRTIDELSSKNRTGIYHVTNPGAIRHSDIMSMYQELVDPTHQHTLISMQELLERGLAKTGRSNCVLSTRKLQSEGIILQDAHEGIRACLVNYKKHLSDK